METSSRFTAWHWGALGAYTEAYTGQQGGIWDSQKDMAIALVGAVLAGGVLGLNGLRKRR